MKKGGGEPQIVPKGKGRTEGDREFFLSKKRKKKKGRMVKQRGDKKESARQKEKGQPPSRLGKTIFPKKAEKKGREGPPGARTGAKRRGRKEIGGRGPAIQAGDGSG